MKLFVKAFLAIFVLMINLSCGTNNQAVFKPVEVYKSKDLIITQITENSFEHTSFKQTDDFGYVPCNGLVVRDANETILFDTPTNDKASEELIQWIKDDLHCKINAVIPTHFHDDCLGGLKAFHEKNIPSYANSKTIELAKENHVPVPQNSFTDSLDLKVGNKNVIARFVGEGHTRDNIIGYFPSENVMFGGCLIKERGANKGYVGDANLTVWSGTVEKVKQLYPRVRVVVPGHGLFGDKRLLDYTIKLFRVR